MTDAPPDLRVLQANERTLLAWVRTGLTLMAFGFVVARLAVWLRIEHPGEAGTGVAVWLGGIVIALGTACHVVGAYRFVRARSAILSGRTIVPGLAGPIGVTLAVAAIGVAAIVYVATTA